LAVMLDRSPRPSWEPLSRSTSFATITTAVTRWIDSFPRVECALEAIAGILGE
jgi:hypothetical protein